MAHSNVVPFDISKQFSFQSKNRNKAYFKQRCLLKDELKMYGQTLM